MKTMLRLATLAITTVLFSACSQYQVKSAQNMETSDYRNWSGFPHASPPIPLQETVRL